MSGKFRNAALAGAGLLALAAYCIACRASFSPDGKKVLIPSLDSVLLHDIPSGKTEVLFAISRSPSSDQNLFSAVWMGDGKGAVLAWPEKEGGERLRVILLPVGTGGPARLFTLNLAKPMESLAVPPVLIGHRLYLGGEGIACLDLDTGEIKGRETGRETYLYGQDDKVFVMAEAKGDDEGWEVGVFHPRDLSEEPVLKLKKSEQGDVNGFLAIARDGRIALAAEKDGKQSISIISGKAIERTVEVGKTAEIGRLGNLQWSSDGKAIYAAYGKKLDGTACQLGVLEVALAGGASPRTIPILRASGDRGDSDPEKKLLLFFQIALSGDGKTLAASGATIEPEEGRAEDHALFLLDLSSPDRKVTRIPLPMTGAPGSSGKG